MNPSYDTHNISFEIAELARKHPSLEPLATGGGIDYVSKPLNNGGIAVLAAGDGPGSPDVDDEPSCVVIYPDAKEWGESWFLFSFPTAREALTWMAAMPAEFTSTLAAGEDKAPAPAGFHRIKVRLFGNPEIIVDAWTTGDRWNGFACPQFEREALGAVLADCITCGNTFRLEGDTKILRITDPDNEDTQAYEAAKILTPDGEKTVWAVGCYEWAWIEA